MKKITFLLHGQLKKADDLKPVLFGRFGGDFQVLFAPTRGQGDGIRIARDAVNAGTDYIISVGGDGTINEMINGIMQSKDALRQKVIAGCLPYGTGNDFAKTAGIKQDYRQLANLIEKDKIQKIDIGKAKFTGHKGEPLMRFFNNITDVGIGGQVVKTVARSGKWMGPSMTYFKSIFQSFLSYKHKKVRLTSPELEWEGPILSLVMANGRYFGSGMCIAPQADPQDGILQLVIMGNVSLMDYLKNMSNVKAGKIIDHPEVQYHAVSSLKIEPLGEEEVPVDMDGEFVGYAPIEVDVVPEAINFLWGN